MNTSTLSPSEEEKLIQQKNDEKVDLMIPAITYIVVMMVSGLIGNSMVAYYYIFKAKVTTNSIFITSLALYDLITCTICMPTEIADLVLFYAFDNSTACKILRFLSYLAAWSSALTLIAICVDRYKQIYIRTGRQMTIDNVKKILVVVFVIALILSWPSFLFYSSVHVMIPNDIGLNLYGYDCAITKDLAYRGYVWAFNIVNFLMFTICSVVLTVLYSIIGHTIYQHGKQIGRYGKKMKIPKESKGQSISSNTTSSTTTNSKPKKPSYSNCSSIQKNSTTEFTSQNTCKSKRQSKGIASTEKQESPAPDMKARLDNVSVRITMVMIAVTVIFIASFLPYLSVTVWLVAEGKQEDQFLSGAGLVVFKIMQRSYLLNSSLNPWIYGLFNSSFRNFYFAKLSFRNVKPQ